MHYDDFIGKVSYKARLASREEAVTAIRATLTTFAKRLQPDVAENLASQLPKEIGIFLKRTGAEPYAERLTLQQFFEGVAECEGTDLPTASFHAVNVLKVLVDALSEGELKHLKASLPDEFDGLLKETIAHGPLH